MYVISANSLQYYLLLLFGGWGEAVCFFIFYPLLIFLEGGVSLFGFFNYISLIRLFGDNNDDDYLEIMIVIIDSFCVFLIFFVAVTTCSRYPETEDQQLISQTIFCLPQKQTQKPKQKFSKKLTSLIWTWFPHWKGKNPVFGENKVPSVVFCISCLGLCML